MSSPIVGKAQIEITASLGDLGAQLSGQVNEAMAGVNETVGAQLGTLSEQFGEAGSTAGGAFGAAATDAVATSPIDSAAAVDADGAATAFGAAGDAAGTAFGDAATETIGLGTDAAAAAAGDAIATGGVDSFGIAGAGAGDAFASGAADAIDSGSSGIDDSVATIADSLSADDAFGDAGSSAGDAFSDGLSDGVDSGSSGGGVLTPLADSMDESRPFVNAAATSVAVESGDKAAEKMGEKGKEAGTRFGSGVSDGFSAIKGTIIGGLGILGIGELVSGSIQAADDVQSASQKTANVFGNSAGVISAFGEKAVTSLRESSVAAETLADQYGVFFESLGRSQPQAATMAANLSAITANVAVFNNVSQQTVESAFDSALKGRTTALAQLGIQITPAILGHEALTHGLDTTNQKFKDGLPILSKQQTAMAAYYAIGDQTTRMQGAIAQSSGTARAQQAQMAAETDELKAKLGQGLLPILVDGENILINDVIPALEATGHWIVQNKAWIEPLAIVVGGLWASFKIGETTYKIFDTISGKIKSVKTAFEDTVNGVKSLFGKWGSAEATKTAETDTAAKAQNTAINSTVTAQERLNTAQGESPGLMEREGTAAGVLAGEMDALATSTQAAADAQAELDATRGAGGGVGGPAGRVGGVASEAEGEATAAEGELTGLEGAAGEASTAIAGVGEAGAVAGEAGAVGMAGIGEGALAVLGPVGLAVGAVGALGYGINKIDGDSKRWAQGQSEITDLVGNNKAAIASWTQAVEADNGAVGQSTATYAAMQLQQNGVADAAAKAGVSLTSLTTGVTGSDTGWQNLITTLQQSGQVSSATMIKLIGMRRSLEDGTTAAAAAKTKQDQLNAAVASFKSPPPIQLTAIDKNVAKTISTAHSELENLNGQSATVYIAAITDTGGALSARGTTATVHFNAAGTPSMKEGWNVVGDAGPELLHKSGSSVEVISNAEMMAGFSRGASAASGAANAGGGGGISMSDLQQIAEYLANRPAIFRVDRRDLAIATNEGNMRLGRQ